MTDATPTLADFLLARIAEDEAAAREQLEIDAEFPAPNGYAMEYGWHRMLRKVSSGRVHSSTYAPGSPPPARVLAECDAKRRIVEAWRSALLAPSVDDEYSNGTAGGYESGLEEAVALLAAAHADHPDYDESWRP